MKRKFFLVTFFILLIMTLALYKFNIKHFNNERKDDILIKTNSPSFSKDDFYYYYNYLKLNNYRNLNNLELKKVTKEHLIYLCKICDLKLSDSVIKLNNSELLKHKMFLDNRRINAAKLKFFKIPYLTLGQIKKIYERNKFICIIDEIFIPLEKKSELKKVYDEVKNGADATVIQRGKSGVPAIRRSIEIGYLPLEIEGIVYKMNIGDIKTIKTKGGHYIIRLVQKIASIHYDDIFDPELIRINYTANYTSKQSEKWIEDKIINNKKIKFDDISRIDFSSRPLPKKYRDINNKKERSEKIVAILNGNIYTIKKLKDRINKLPEGIQLFFYNQQTRLQATKSLLYYQEAGYKFMKTSTEYLRNVKNTMLIEKILGIKIDNLKKNLDTTSYQEYIINGLYTKIIGSKSINDYNSIADILMDDPNKLQVQNSLQKAFLNVVKSIYYRRLQEKEESNAFPWLYPEACNKNDSFFIDQRLLYNLQFTTGLDKKNIVFCKNWNLTVDDLFSELRRLSKETRTEIQTQKQLLELVVLLGEKNNIKKQSLIINYQLLSYILPLLLKIELPSLPPDDDEVAATIDKSQFTFDNLKSRWVDINDNQNNRFLTKEQITRIIEELYFLKVVNNQKSNRDLEAIVLWKVLNDFSVDYHKYNFSDLTIKTVYNLLQEEFQKEKTLQAITKTDNEMKIYFENKKLENLN